MGMIEIPRNNKDVVLNMNILYMTPGWHISNCRVNWHCSSAHMLSGVKKEYYQECSVVQSMLSGFYFYLVYLIITYDSCMFFFCPVFTFKVDFQCGKGR